EWRRFMGEQQGYEPICAFGSLVEADRSALDHRPAAGEQFAQVVAAATAGNDVRLNSSICWIGSLDGFAAVVMPACDRAVTLGGDNAGFFQDSRGLAHALLGQTTEAQEDFQAFITWSRR